MMTLVLVAFLVSNLHFNLWHFKKATKFTTREALANVVETNLLGVKSDTLIDARWLASRQLWNNLSFVGHFQAIILVATILFTITN